MTAAGLLYGLAALLLFIAGATLAAYILVRWFSAVADLLWIGVLRFGLTAATLFVLTMGAVVLWATLGPRLPSGEIPRNLVAFGTILLLPLLAGAGANIASRVTGGALAPAPPFMQDAATGRRARCRAALSSFRRVVLSDVFDRVQAEQRRRYVPPPYTAFSSDELL